MVIVNLKYFVIDIIHSQRDLLFFNFRARHLMNDLQTLMPHSKSGKLKVNRSCEAVFAATQFGHRAMLC
jgi:hypothetical protein